MVSASATVEIGRPRSAETKLSVAILAIVAPRPASALMVTEYVTVADCPAPSVPPAVEVAPEPRRAMITPDSLATLPLPELTLGAGVVIVVPDGTGSCSSTLVASPVPLFVAVIV